MKYTKFAKIFNDQIFEKSRPLLLEKIAKYPNRYLGLFRPTKPKAKLLQNLLQSHEIRFGDAFEILIEEYLKEIGCDILDKYFNSGGNYLCVDQCYKFQHRVHFVEQKIRDDHDSSKKRGQIQNFEEKLNAIIKEYSEEDLVGFFYFIDPGLRKNYNYYAEQLNKMSNDYGVELHICYGKEYFGLIQHPSIWDEITEYLVTWKADIRDLPDINFDSSPKESFDDIKGLQPRILRTLFSNDEIYNEIMTVLFPEGKTLCLLRDFFYSNRYKSIIYNTLYKILNNRLS